jgi:hypothetical protein
MADNFLRALRNCATGVRSRSPLKTVALADAERLATGMRMAKRRDYACAYVPKSRDGVSIVSEELVRVLRTSATVDALRAGSLCPGLACHRPFGRAVARPAIDGARPFRADAFPPTQIRRTDDWRAGADFVHASVHATEFQIDHGFKIGFPDWSRELACECYRTIVNEY